MSKTDKILVKPNQTIFDIALKQHGSIESVFDVLENNTELQNLNSNINVSQELNIDSENVSNKEVTDYYDSRGVDPASKEESTHVVVNTPEEISSLVCKNYSLEDKHLILGCLDFSDQQNVDALSSKQNQDLKEGLCLKSLFLTLNYLDTNDIIEVTGDSDNIGDYTLIDSGLEISTDGINYIPLVAPFQLLDAVLYYLKRTTAIVSEVKKLTGTYV